MSLIKTLGPNGWEVDGIEQPLAHWNAAGTALLGPDGVINFGSGGYRTVLIGDSMTDWYDGVAGVTGITYAQSTGILSFTTAATHGLVDGMIVDVFSHQYASLRSVRKLPAIRTGANTFTITLSDKPTDIPDGSVTSSVYLHINNRRDMQSFVHWWQLKNNNVLNIINNAAKSGNMSGFTYDILDSEVLAYNPDIVIGQMPGINDQSDAQTYSYDAVLQNLKNIIDKLSAAVPVVVLGTITPVYTGESRATIKVMQRVICLNKAWTDYAKTKKNVHVFDAYAAIVNATDTTGLAKVGVLGGDNIHYHAKGAILVYKELDKVLSKLIPVSQNTLPKSVLEQHTVGAITVSSMSRTSNIVTVNATAHGRRVGDYAHVTGATPATANGLFPIASVATNSFTYAQTGADESITGMTVSTCRNIHANSLLQTTTGGVVGGGFTGTAADGFACSPQAGTPTAVASVSASASGFGNEQVLVVSAAVLDDRVKIDTEWVGTFGNRMIPGYSYEAECLLRINSANWTNTPVSELYCVFSIGMSDGVTIKSTLLGNWDSTAATTITEDSSLHLKFHQIPIPNTGATVSSAQLTIYIRAGGAWTSNLTMGLSQCAVRIV